MRALIMRQQWTLYLFFLLALFICWSTAAAGGDQDIGARFHRETSMSWLSVIKGLVVGKPAAPPPYKKMGGEKIISLPKPEFKGMLLEETISRRRSVRNFSRKPVTLAELSQLLFAAQGITGKIYDTPLRTAPSAGALYPFEIYLVVNRGEGLEPGIYHYLIRDHALEQIKSGDFRKEINSAGLQQDMLGEAAVTFVLTAIFDRTRSKYGERGYRYVYIEAGHIGQNISLQVVSLGLGSVTVGAFLDDRVNELIGVDGVKETAIYLQAVGRP
jgi:SagB-type dehydrogenase family enzyme